MKKTLPTRAPRFKFLQVLLLLAGWAAGPALGQSSAYQIRNPQLFPTSSCCWAGKPSVVLMSFRSNRPASTVHSVAVESGKVRITLRNPESFEPGIVYDQWVAVDIPPVDQAGSLPVEISTVGSPDDPQPQVLDPQQNSVSPLVFQASPVKVLGVVPPFPGPEDEIEVMLDSEPSDPLAVVRGGNHQVHLLGPSISWSPAPEGWPVSIGRLPAGSWRVLVENTAEIRVEVKEPPAGPGGPVLLAGGFEVEAAWSTLAGEQGQARLVQPPSRDSALFYFFSQANWELMVKVLDGCALNNHYWVFGAASTDVGYTIDIRRLNSTQTYHYENPLGRTAPAITDIEAFPCDPEADTGT